MGASGLLSYHDVGSLTLTSYLSVYDAETECLKTGKNKKGMDSAIPSGNRSKNTRKKTQPYVLQKPCKR
jgi:hypothetical protein